MATKEMKEVVVEAVPVQNDSSEGLAQLYRDLDPLASRLRCSATMLLFFSLCLLGSVEGLFGMIAAAGILCCAAPGSLGTAYAARCSRITATIAAAFALMHFAAVTSFAYVVLPTMPQEVKGVCASATGAPGATDEGKAALLIASSVGAILPSDSEAGAPSTAVVAPLVASAASKAGRMLAQTLELPTDDVAHCERLGRFFTNVAPGALMMLGLLELGLFFNAMSTAKIAALLVKQARRFGANGI